MYGLPQAGIIANTRLKAHLATWGYHPCTHTPGLFRLQTRPVTFCLVVDDFGIKYKDREHADHLLLCLQSIYTVTTDWEGTKYCGLTLDWNYTARTEALSMPGYVAKALHRFQHPHRKKMLVALGTIAAAQTNHQSAQAVTQLLNYAATNPDASILYHASDMVLHVHLDASHQSESHARSRSGGFFFMSSNDPNHTTTIDPHASPPPINGNVHVPSTILKVVVSSAAKAELGALFYQLEKRLDQPTSLNLKRVNLCKRAITSVILQMGKSPRNTKLNSGY
jgi:hypothetical protein